MEIMKYFIILWALVLLSQGCNESLEDTYEEWTGDGRVRYPAKCFDLEITPGWERLTVNWKNGTDATIKNIKLSWSADELKDSVLLVPTDTLFDIVGLIDASYQISIQSITESGRVSLKEMNYGRPYTFEHEMVRTFPTGITKFYSLADKNTFIYFTNSSKNTGIVEMKLHYTDVNGQAVVQDVWELEEDGRRKTYYVLENVALDEQDSIYISRIGLLEGCPDTILFKPLIIRKNEKNYTSNFKTAIQRRYGLSSQTDAQKIAFDYFIDTVRTLEFDYDMFSFEDVLYCTNLKKIVLGKNRYYWEGAPLTELSSLYSVEQSVDVLKTANELRGVTIEQYNDHYSTLNKELAFMMTPMGNPRLPELTYVKESDIDTIKCSEKDPQGYDSQLEYLFDNNPATQWQTYTQGDLRTYEIVVKFKERQFVRGFEIRQPRGEAASVRCYYPNQIKIEFSNDQIAWTNTTVMSEYLLGRAPGERTLLHVTNPSEVLYVRITMSDQTFISNNSLTLADIVPFL